MVCMNVQRFFCRILALLLFAFLPLLFSSCAGNRDTAVLWTDRPELAFYAGFFNASQNRFKVEVRYFSSPSQRLAESNEIPDIVVASWLRNTSTQALFRPLGALFFRSVDRASFYPQLLELGQVGRRQHLLPVNFNIPAIVFSSRYSDGHENPFTIEITEIMERGKAHNVVTNGIFSRLGFSPLSNTEFMFMVMTLFGANFHESSPVAWNDEAVEQAIAWIRNWITEANVSIQMEEAFTEKFHFESPERMVSTGQILYTHMLSDRFFTLPGDRGTNLDFRWIASDGMIPLDDRGVYFGIHRRARSRRAAHAFAQWLFSAETQQMLLKEKRRERLSETSFGIAGGFSAMRTVTEQVFPQFYPSLLGRMPPDNFYSPANMLPRNWVAIKEWVVLPYLFDRVRHTGSGDLRPLDRRVIDWYRLNRG
jgi:hypothetical protein